MTDFGLPDFIVKPLSVVLIDLLLAGDNALAIALVCRALQPRQQRVVLGLATIGAMVARVLLVTIASGLLMVPGLKLLGGGLLALLAINLACPRKGHANAPPALNGQTDVLGAAVLLTLIDVLMGVDNVLALAAVAGGNILYLALGLTLSVGILMFGSTLVGHLLRRYPELNRLGVALLGWIAGKMLVSDPLLAGWIAQQAPALPLIVPALAAIYVYLLDGNVPEPAWPDMDALPAAPVVRRPIPVAPVAPLPVEPPPMEPLLVEPPPMEPLLVEPPLAAALVAEPVASVARPAEPAAPLAEPDIPAAEPAPVPPRPVAETEAENEEPATVGIEIWMFAALFLIGGIFLAIVTMFAGEIQF